MNRQDAKSTKFLGQLSEMSASKELNEARWLVTAFAAPFAGFAAACLIGYLNPYRVDFPGISGTDEQMRHYYQWHDWNWWTAYLGGLPFILIGCVALAKLTWIIWHAPTVSAIIVLLAFYLYYLGVLTFVIVGPVFRGG